MLKVSQTEIQEQPRGYGVNKSPPERLRTQKKTKAHLKIVKFVEVALRKEEACGYTCQSQSQDVRRFWTVAKISRESVAPRNNTTVVLLKVIVQTQQPIQKKLLSRKRCGQFSVHIQKHSHRT